MNCQHRSTPWRLPFALLPTLGLFVACAARLAAAPAAAPAPAPARAVEENAQSRVRKLPQPPHAPGAATRPAGPLAPFGVPRKTQDFVRFVEDGKGGGKLEAAVVTYRNARGVTVHLVSALHVGEKSYYEGLTKTFRRYDAVLYELIKPKGSDIPRPGVKSGGTVSGLQRFLKDTLELEFQLDSIDYSAANFVHADLDAETFFELQEQRGESLLSLMFRSMLSEMQRQSQGKGAPPITVFDLLAAMNSPDSARQYKLLLARQFQDIEAQLAGLEGEQGTVIVTERNKAALKVLKETLAAGKKNIGVFYGAGHMRGLEEALLGQMGFRRTAIEWRVAWDMTGPGPATRPTTRPATPPITRPNAVRPAPRPTQAPRKPTAVDE